MAVRLRRICSTDEFFNTDSSALTTHLIKRGYKHRLVKEAIEKARSQIPRSTALETSIKGVPQNPFVITFNPALPNIPQVISNNLNNLRSSQRCLEAFYSPPRCKNFNLKHRWVPVLVTDKKRWIVSLKPSRLAKADDFVYVVHMHALMGNGKACKRAKWPIRLELIPVSVTRNV